MNMKEAKRRQITAEICKQVKLMRKGGANQTEIGALLGINPSTISRIESAGFDVDKYMENKRASRVKEAERRRVELVYDTPILEEYRKENGLTYSGTEEKAEDQLPGQIKMELRPVQETAEDQTKMMRFQAAMVDRLIVELDKFNDTLNMILRVLRKE